MDRIRPGRTDLHFHVLPGVDEGPQPLQPAAAELRARGYGLVLAHPERASGVLAGGCRILRAELDAGCVAQVSVSSLTGAHGHESQVSGRALVDARLVHVLASDAHFPRPAPALAAGMDQLLG